MGDYPSEEALRADFPRASRNAAGELVSEYQGMSVIKLHNRLQPDDLLFLDPIIANYTHGKESDLNQETLQKIRMKAIHAIQNAAEVVVWGVNPILDKLDDSFCAEAFVELRKKKRVDIYNLKSVHEQISKILPQANFFDVQSENFLKNICDNRG